MDYKKTIWILNHHATGMALQHGGRHYYFTKYLIEKGYDVRIFCASVLHNSQEDAVDLQGNISTELIVDGIPFVFVKTRKYRGNGISRVLGMFDYYFNVKKACKQYSRPDVIIGSSVHPLACVAAIHLSKRYSCKNIVEIRDLWPESIVEYGLASSQNLLMKYLYHFEKWLYTRANALVFTIEGGKDYIIEKGWDKLHGGPVDLDKVHHINNGVDLDIFDRNIQEKVIDDTDLDNPDSFKFVYTGSIRRANNLDLVLDAAKLVKNPKIQFLIWGEGDQLTRLKQRLKDEQIQNVIFKGKVGKHFVPGILHRADATFFVLENSPLFRFGLSLNKSFEYLAAGKPLLIIGDAAYSMIDEYKCGYHLRENSPEKFSKSVEQLVGLDSREYQALCENARDAAKKYDFKVLTDKLIELLECNSSP
jgi:glycosyltransferase involved in cell wall biosynthesis